MKKCLLHFKYYIIFLSTFLYFSFRGRSPEWYNRAYGHLCTHLLVKLRNSFARVRADGPETKV